MAPDHSHYLAVYYSNDLDAAADIAAAVAVVVVVSLYGLVPLD